MRRIDVWIFRPLVRETPFGGALSNTLILFLPLWLASVATSQESDAERLAESIREYKRLELELESAIANAEAAEPRLAAMKAERAEMKRWYLDDLGKTDLRIRQGQSDGEFGVDRKEFDAVYASMKNRSLAASLLQDASDPKWGPILRHEIVPRLVTFAKDSGALLEQWGLDPNEPDWDVIWEGWLSHMSKQAAFNEEKLRAIAPEHNIPEWAVQHARDKGRGEFYLQMFGAIVFDLTPAEVTEAEQRLKQCAIELSRIDPNWGRFLADDNIRTNNSEDQPD